MNIGNWIALAVVLISILAHAFATVWWASRVSNTLHNILLALVRIDAEFEKRDKQIARLWEKVDNHSQTLSSHSTMLQINKEK